jgi:hypothetical protein
VRGLLRGVKCASKSATRRDELSSGAKAQFEPAVLRGGYKPPPPKEKAKAKSRSLGCARDDRFFLGAAFNLGCKFPGLWAEGADGDDVVFGFAEAGGGYAFVLLVG